MKKRMFGIAMITMLCLLLGTVFGAESFQSRAEAAAPAAEEIASRAPVDTPIPADKWQEAYETILAAFSEEFGDEFGFSHYVLYDVDGDKLPELIIGSGTCEADYKYSLYRFNPGKGAEFVVNFGYGHSMLCGISGENALLIYGCHMGYEWVDRLTWNGTLYEQDHVVEGRMLGEDEDPLPLEPLGYYRLEAPFTLDWAGNPGEENAALIAPLRMGEPELDSYVSYRQHVAQSSLPADSRFVIANLDNEGAEELFYCSEDGMRGTLCIVRLNGAALEPLFKAEVPLAGAAGFGLRQVDWDGAPRLFYWYSNGEMKEENTFETVTQWSLLEPDGAVSLSFFTVAHNGELVSVSPEAGLDPEGFRESFDGSLELLNFAAKYGEMSDLAQDREAFLGW